METTLKNKRALITGSNNGLGEAIAKMLAKEGVAVIIHGRNEERAEKVVEEIRLEGGNAQVVLGDLSTDNGAKTVAKKSLEGGNIDILINNAGAYAHTGWMNTTPQ